MLEIADRGRLLLLLKLRPQRAIMAADIAIERINALLKDRGEPGPIATTYLWGKSDLLLAIETTNLGLLSALSPIPDVTRYNHVACYEWVGTGIEPLDEARRLISTYVFIKFNPSLLRSKGVDLERAFVASISRLLVAEQQQGHAFAARIFGTVGWIDVIVELQTESNLRLLVDLLHAISNTSHSPGATANCLFTTFSLVGYRFDIFRRILSNEFASVDDFAAAFHVLDHDAIYPTVQLRVQPSLVQVTLASFKQAFGAHAWQSVILNGKNNLLLLPSPGPASVASDSPPAVTLARFLFNSVRFIHASGVESEILNAETYFFFPPKDTAIAAPPLAAVPVPQCRCLEEIPESSGAWEALSQAQFPDSSVRNSLLSFLSLYSACRYDRLSCCDLSDLSPFVTALARAVRGESEIGDDQEAISRLIRDGSIHGKRIINQRRSGNYEDLLEANDRITIFKGGVQKIITMLNGVVAETLTSTGIADLAGWLPVVFRYSVLESIESYPHIGLIEIPIRLLFRIHQAGWQLWHEIGEIYWFHRMPQDGPIVQALEDYLIEVYKVDSAPDWKLLAQAENQTPKEIFCDLFAVHYGFCLDYRLWADLVTNEVCDHLRSLKECGKTKVMTVQIVNCVVRLVAIFVHKGRGGLTFSLPPIDQNADSSLFIQHSISEAIAKLQLAATANKLDLSENWGAIRRDVILHFLHNRNSVLPVLLSFSAFFEALAQVSLPKGDRSLNKLIREMADYELQKRADGGHVPLEHYQPFFKASVDAGLKLLDLAYLFTQQVEAERNVALR